MSNTAMVSRSLRIDKETLGILEEQAREQEIGITVYIRMILQSFVGNFLQEKALKEFEEAVLSGEIGGPVSE